MDSKEPSMLYNEYNEPIAPLAPDADKQAVIKAEYEGNMERCLKEFGAKLDELLAKTDSAKCQALAELKTKHSSACDKLTEIKSSSSLAWTEMKIGLDRACVEMGKAWDELKAASERASQKFTH